MRIAAKNSPTALEAGRSTVTRIEKPDENENFCEATRPGSAPEVGRLPAAPHRTAGRPICPGVPNFRGDWRLWAGGSAGKRCGRPGPWLEPRFDYHHGRQ